MTTWIAISRDVIERNRKRGRCEPPILVGDGVVGAVRCHKAVIEGPSEVVYDREGNLPHDAQVAIRTEAQVIAYRYDERVEGGENGTD